MNETSTNESQPNLNQYVDDEMIKYYDNFRFKMVDIFPVTIEVQKYCHVSWGPFITNIIPISVWITNLMSIKI